jgi:hypothetical protein
MRRPCLALLGLLAASPAAAADQPLFASDQPLRIELRGALPTLARGSRSQGKSIPATLKVNGETLPVTLALRGITRLTKSTCQFPPLRVSFAAPAPASSLFASQDRLKLVTHCRQPEDFQQFVLLEYAAYRLYNLLTPLSMRARLAQIDYVDDKGTPFVSRYGFFIEDDGSAARREGLRKAKVGTKVPLRQIDPAAAARMVLFEYMIGNLDWALQAGAEGSECCHNGRLVAPATLGGGLQPMPYDFDYSGFVNAPYAEPPDGFTISSVRERVYRGYCIHNASVAVAARDFRAKRDLLLAEVARTPGLAPKRLRDAQVYLGQFFDEIATDQLVQSRILAKCLRP